MKGQRVCLVFEKKNINSWNIKGRQYIFDIKKS